MDPKLKSAYRNWQRGLSEADKRLDDERRETLGEFDHSASWRRIDDLLEVGLRHRGEERLSSGLVQFRAMLVASAAGKGSNGPRQ